MKFTHENGILLDPNGEIITMITGEGSATEFPEELALRLNKLKPGHVFEFAHTHPPGVLDISDRDKLTMKTWAFTIYPFPVRMSVLSHHRGNRLFYYHRFIGMLEPKETWIARGKGVRAFKIVREKVLRLHEEDLKDIDGWRGILLRSSYEDDLEIN